VRSIDEWAEVLDKNVVKELEKLAMQKDNMHWKLPNEPDPSEEDPTLFEDLIAFIRGFIEFPQDRIDSCLAAWIICTYLTEELCHAPRFLLSGPTEHGKGRVLKITDLLAYRAVLLADPTVAVLYRLSGWYRSTILIDEIQDLQANQKEVYGRIMALFKIGFDVGAVVPRMSPDYKTVEGFKTHSFVMVVAKNFNFKEDEQNRAIMVTMKKRTRGLRTDPMGDPEVALQAELLRTRLHAFRIRVKLGLEDVEGWKARANELKMMDVMLEDSDPDTGGNQRERVVLEDRSREIAVTLLLPCIRFGREDDILQTVADAQKKAKVEQNNTLASQAFSALQCQLYGALKGEAKNLDLSIAQMTPQELSGILDKARITVASIRDQLIKDMVNGNASEDEAQIPDTSSSDGRGDSWKMDEGLKGALRKYEALETRYPTKRVGTALRKELGFVTKEGTQNKMYVTAKKFQEAYRSALQSFGSRYSRETLEG
jgi:hypothetical protein